MTIEKTLQINAPASHVWAVLAHDFHNAYKWASSINHSAVRHAGPPPGDAPFETAGRACQTSLGPIKETLEYYDEQARRFGYSAKGDKMPFFVKHLQNNWSVKANGPNRSTVVMAMEARLMPVFAQLMGPIMRKQFDTVLTEATEELKFYIEHGQPHPRKAEAMEKQAVAA